MRALEGHEDSIQDVTPDCVKVLVSEYATLGETLISQTMSHFAVIDQTEGASDVIEFASLVQIISMLKYSCQFADENDLRFWLFNKSVITKTPKFYQQDRIYIDCERLLWALREEGKRLGLIDSEAQARKDRRDMKTARIPDV